MPTDTKGVKYQDVWVVYVSLKPCYSCFTPETHWDKFDTELEAIKKYEEWQAHPRLLETEPIRKYKLYRLEGPK